VSVAATRPWPFDLDGLTKGSLIGPEDIERVTGVRRGAQNWRLAVMRAASLLERQWAKERGEKITFRTTADSVVICTADEASTVNEQRTGRRKRGLRRDFVRQRAVGRAELSSDDKRQAHERSLITMGAFLSGGQRAAQAVLKPVERKTPGLPSKK
jgi:hypothetical protein